MHNPIIKITYSFQTHYVPGVYIASNTNEYQKMFLRSKARQARKANNLTAICESIV
jgi:hypothetical protein